MWFGPSILLGRFMMCTCVATLPKVLSRFQWPRQFYACLKSLSLWRGIKHWHSEWVIGLGSWNWTEKKKHQVRLNFCQTEQKISFRIEFFQEFFVLQWRNWAYDSQFLVATNRKYVRWQHFKIDLTTGLQGRYHSLLPARRAIEKKIRQTAWKCPS